MTVYEVSYDLNKPGQEYDELHEAIKSLGSWTHILESTWLIDTDEDSAGDVRDNLKLHVDSGDKLFVTKVGGSGWSWGTNFSDSSTAWLKDHLE